MCYQDNWETQMYRVAYYSVDTEQFLGLKEDNYKVMALEIAVRCNP